MKHRGASWALAAVAAGALLGCTSGDDDSGVNNMAGIGGAAPMGGMQAPPAGAPGTMMMSHPSTAGGMGGGGAPAAQGGMSGATAAGASGSTAGMMAGMAGMMPAPDAGPAADPDAGMPPAMATGTCGPATTVSAADLGDPMKGKGPWATAMKAGSGPSGSSTLFYPMELGKDGVKHPVFHWGCGAGSQPSQYADHLTLLASHGIVVIANASGSMPAKASLDWLLAENEKSGSMFYQKLDPERVATGGHSLGALETFQFASDPRLKTYVLVCGGSGSGTTGAANIHAPSIFLGGEGEGGTTNFAADYDAIKDQPSVFVTKTSTDHIYCARNNLGPWVAFMRWNLCGEEAQWKKEFMPDGTYCKSPWLACKTKGL